MNLFPFVTLGNKDTVIKKRDIDNTSAVKYEQKLAEYKDTLDKYKDYIMEISDKIEGFDKRSMDNPFAIIQTALDLTYLKEQGDRTVELIEKLRSEDYNRVYDQGSKILNQGNKALEELEGLIATMIETNYKLEGLDQNAVNRLSDILVELQKQTIFQFDQKQQELQANMNTLSKSVKRSKTLLWFLFTFQIISLGAFAFIILYLLEIIV